MIKKSTLPLLFLAILFSFETHAQQTTTVSGQVKDAESGDPIPFANVYFTGTQIGATTDFDGKFNIAIDQLKNSITASYIGYIAQSFPVQSGIENKISFQLQPELFRLEELVFEAGENPAFELLRKVIAKKKSNNKEELSGYSYESYTKIEFDVDNLSEKMRNRKIMKKVTAVMDSIAVISGENGKPILPVFLSESISEFYWRNNPKLTKEKIIKTNIKGVGISDGSLTSQLIGSSFQEYNFYRNWLSILDKEFVSPIADGWRIYYDYELADSLMIGDDFCYRLEVYPRRDQDLAFHGTIWVNKADYALKQVDLEINKSANLNFIEKIKIQQELAKSAAGPYLPNKTRVLLDIAEVSKNTPGMLAKFYISNKNFLVNKPKNTVFFDQEIEVDPDYAKFESEDWQEFRHEPLTSTEENVFTMIDTLTKIPVVKTYVELMNIFVAGYKTVGKVDVGPYLMAYSYNNIEGSRFRLGFRTNEDFSNKWLMKAYAAYGTADKRWKYGLSASYIADRSRWTQLTVSQGRDISLVPFNDLDFSDNEIFLAYSQIGDLTQPQLKTYYEVDMHRQVFKGVRQKVSLRNEYVESLYPFEYFVNPEQNTETRSNYTNTALTFESRIARDERFIIADNERISLGTKKWPVLTVQFTIGLKGAFGADFNYHKLQLILDQDVNMGFLGRSYYKIDAGKVFSDVPYPFLKSHIGNETPFYTSAAFNLMDNFEFVSDTYASIKYNHFFEGFILNRIPVMKKLKWRLVANANVLVGSVSESNQNLLPEFSATGEELERFKGLGVKPYIELGYGIENIFKVIRVDAFHRLSYLNNPDVRKFGFKISFQFIL